MYQDSNAQINKTSDINYYRFEEDFNQLQNQQANGDYQQVHYGQNVDVSNKCSINQENQLDDERQISLEEIDAIINSKDFGDLVHQKANIEQVATYSKLITCGQGEPNNLVSNQENLNAYEPRLTYLNDHQQTYLNGQPQQQQQQQQPEYEQMLKPINNHLNPSRQPFDANCSPDEMNNKMTAENQANCFNFQYPLQQDDNVRSVLNEPYVEIVEQPAKCSLRFRYKCEGRSAGSLPGVSSTGDNKTYPAIRIVNYVGRAVVVVSCVTKDAPYKAHPHNIVGKEGCKKGICTIVISNNEPNTVRTFSSLGIQCVKRKDIEESLNMRESINVDPFRNGFAHKFSPSTIDLNVVRLSFQVFIVGSTPNKCDVPLMPIVSDPIHDKKAMSDLVITKLSHCSAPATGGREIILLCDRISKDDIQIRFYEEQNGKIIWETNSELSPADIHKQVAICFKTPKYYNENITEAVMVRIQLKRPSDNQESEPRLFQFLPVESDDDMISRKRQKYNQYALDNIFQPSYQHQQAIMNITRPNQRQHQAPNLDMNRQQSIRQSETSPSSSQAQRISPLPPGRHQQVGGSPAQLTSESPSSRTPSPLQQQHHNQHHQNQHRQQQQQQQQQSNQADERSQNLVVRHEIIDNDGNVMRLVDRPTDSREDQMQQRQQQQGANIDQNQPLGDSLDRINTAELMHDVMGFNSNMDLNLGPNLSLGLNPPD